VILTGLFLSRSGFEVNEDVNPVSIPGKLRRHTAVSQAVLCCLGPYMAAMIVVGTHYLPFITLYGMKMFGILAGLLIAFGAGLALYGPDVFTPGGWITAVLMTGFAFLGRHQVLQEEKQ
jgi:hypothetical protein